ncbi:Auxin transporter protein [Actinidia chinensis var. chinensis]|uniref:Auxin transporter protein n=1 Tax=Actinidia chinensis var. chinensis TaxID=1590841 RepID=A0A2R6QGI1_ACTCC|nr:Auxin transporter protein [Actinidia chinensis var. chinensis]
MGIFVTLSVWSNYARNLETPKIQVHILDGHTRRFHANTFVSFLCLLGFRRQTSQPLERLLPPPQDPLACAVILMLIHQFITFGFACTPLYFVLENVIGMHDTKSVWLRALARLPVVIPIWFLAIIFPFFGPIDSAVGALLVSFTVYIIPVLAHMLTYRKASARQVLCTLRATNDIHIL